MALPQEKPGGVYQPNPGQVRRSTTGINTDWQYLKKKEPIRAANDDGYGQSSKPTIDERYADTAFSDKMLGPVGLGDKASPKKTSNTEQYQVNSGSPTYRRSPLRTRKSLATSLVDPQVMVARAKATTVSIETLAWQVPVWLTIQLPFAVLGAITLGAVGAIDSATTSTGGILNSLMSATLSVASSLASVFGIDFMQIALALYMITYMLVLGVGLFSMFTLYFQYTLSGLRPLSGTGEGLKLGMLLLTCIGYAVPLVNMFPFIVLWMAAVWLYPK